MDIQELIRGISGCTCGRDHICPIETVAIGPDVLDRLEEKCRAFDKIVLLADENTWDACGKMVAEKLSAKNPIVVVLPYGKERLVPNEAAVELAESQMSEDVDLIVGVGSGVINDMSRYISYKRKISYYIVATAPSMDGYASTVAAMLFGGMKTTLPSHTPKAIFAVSDVIRNAPMEMLQAGYGDIVGKFSSLNDWKLGALLYNEYYCQKVYDILYATAIRVRDLAEGILARDAEAVDALMEALVVAGITIAYVGNSRPASGSEHHLSHFFEITGLQENKPYFDHGLDVLYSSVITAKMRTAIAKAHPVRRVIDKVRWEEEIRRVYTGSAEGVFALQKEYGMYERDDFSIIEEKWDEICDLMNEAPNSDEAEKLVEAIGLHFSDMEKMYGIQKLRDCVIYAKDLRDRHSVLWVFNLYTPEVELL